MISIREANTNIDLIMKQHVAFVGKRVETVIDFYLDIFKVLPDLQKGKTTEKTIKENIVKIKNRHSLNDYKTLLYPILKGKSGIKNEDSLIKLKRKQNFAPESKIYPPIHDCLASLKLSFKEILELDYSNNQTAKITKYTKWKADYLPIKFLLTKIFDYESWFSGLDPTDTWGPYQLAMALNIRTCAYCNRHYTFSLTDVLGKKMGRPDFDHFIPKSTDPLLALSFFNLVPSCKECNGPSIKSNKPVSYFSHLNPYEDNSLNGLMRFSYHPRTYEASIGDDDDLEIYLKYSGDATNTALKSKIEGNIGLFCLADIYMHHSDTVQEIIKLRHMSSDRHIEILQSTYDGFNLSREEAYRLAYGNHYLEEEFHKRPLSKLTKDIAIEMESLIVVPKPEY